MSQLEPTDVSGTSRLSGHQLEINAVTLIHMRLFLFVALVLVSVACNDSSKPPARSACHTDEFDACFEIRASGPLLLDGRAVSDESGREYVEEPIVALAHGKQELLDPNDVKLGTTSGVHSLVRMHADARVVDLRRLVMRCRRPGIYMWNWTVEGPGAEPKRMHLPTWREPGVYHYSEVEPRAGGAGFVLCIVQSEEAAATHASSISHAWSVQEFIHKHVHLRASDVTFDEAMDVVRKRSELSGQFWLYFHVTPATTWSEAAPQLARVLEIDPGDYGYWGPDDVEPVADAPCDEHP